MKKIYLIAGALLLTISVFAQSPEKMSYQAVVRDVNNHLIVNQTVGVQISILQNSNLGLPVYVETHSALTNANGLMSLEIGSGNAVSGDFGSINWSDGNYYLKTETDPEGGTSYSITGTSQLMSVPYAFHSKTADSVLGALKITEADTAMWNMHFSGDYSDLSNAPSLVSAFTNDAGYLTESSQADSSSTNELQILSISNDTLFLSDGGFVEIPFGPSDATANDLISFDGENWVSKSAIIQNTGGNLPQNNMQPFLALNHIIALQGIFPSRNSADPFLAEIIMFAGNFAPRGWALCDGQLLPIASYTAVFSLMGTYYGGDGRTTFALPDLRGRTAIHPGTGPGLTRRSIGEKGGTETNTMTINQLPSHTHTIIYQ